MHLRLVDFNENWERANQLIEALVLPMAFHLQSNFLEFIKKLCS